MTVVVNAIAGRDSESARAQWAARIAGAWRKSAEAVLEAGRLLKEARDALPHGAFLDMIERDLPFGAGTAQRLMRIAADARIANAAHGPFLPPSWRTLYELTKLSDHEFGAKLASGEIHPEMEHRDVARENRLTAKARDEARVLNLESAPGRFRTLVVDPPWDYGWFSMAGRGGGPYATMTHDELLALPVESWAEDNAHLYLWTTNNFLTRAVELMARWRFAHKTMLIWVKPRWGLGTYFRAQNEAVLFGVRGNLGTRSDSISTVFKAPLGDHSEKPERFYELVRAASYPPYGEVFQRQARPDFASLFRERPLSEAEPAFRRSHPPQMKRGAPDDRRTPICIKDNDDQTNQTRRLITRGGGHE
jgi:N6-adenosine-specific RNA methylase IME4